jgi:hypothetical protein
MVCAPTVASHGERIPLARVSKSTHKEGHIMEFVPITTAELVLQQLAALDRIEARLIELCTQHGVDVVDAMAEVREKRAHDLDALHSCEIQN